MNTKKIIRLTLATTAGAAVLAIAAGCQSSQPHSHGEDFLPEDQPRTVQAFTDTQAATGARTDATLHECHFDGPQLNSLGRDRIDLMLSDGEAPLPLTVWLDVPKDDLLAQRQNAVLTYLHDQRLSDSEIKLESGPNPNSTVSAAAQMADDKDEHGDKDKKGYQGAETGVPTQANPSGH
jgi:hypothetical protein